MSWTGELINRNVLAVLRRHATEERFFEVETMADELEELRSAGRLTGPWLFKAQALLARWQEEDASARTN